MLQPATARPDAWAHGTWRSLRRGARTGSQRPAGYPANPAIVYSLIPVPTHGSEMRRWKLDRDWFRLSPASDGMSKTRVKLMELSHRRSGQKRKR